MNNKLCPISTVSSLALSNRPNSPIISPISPISPNSPVPHISPISSSDDVLFLVNPEFPPRIDPKDLGQALFSKRKRSKKMLNEFFIYRKEFVRELKRLNLRPKQTKVSSLASASWHKQPSNVKDEYRRIARETERFFMLERQREASECVRTESNGSSSDDASASLTPPPESLYQPPIDEPFPIQMTTYPLNTNNYFWSPPYYYCDMSNMQMQLPVQDTNTYFFRQ